MLVSFLIWLEKVATSMNSERDLMPLMVSCYALECLAKVEAVSSDQQERQMHRVANLELLLFVPKHLSRTWET